MVSSPCNTATVTSTIVEIEEQRQEWFNIMSFEEGREGTVAAF